ncbi:MAG: RNA 2',3'-cyclic phosphodiesterase, partial [Nitrososphaerota archaeon]|nr:RNA 2',3'-cyclic phosphodiesterase [Nitrososphaerota archaeon]
MARCFVSVDIKDEGVLDRIAWVQERLAIDGVKPVERENLHFTLKFLDELDNDQIGLIDRKLASITSVPKFKIRM